MADGPGAESIPATRYRCTVCAQGYGIRNAQPEKRYVCRQCGAPLEPAVAPHENQPTMMDPLDAASALQLELEPAASDITDAQSSPARGGAIGFGHSDALSISDSAGAVGGSPGDASKNLARMLPNEFDGNRLVGELARGGMGAVFEAMQPGLRRKVALKVMLPGAEHNDPNAVARFEREARAMAKLKHPHIIEVHGIGTVNGLPYFTMEFVEGMTLSQFIRGDKLGFPQIAAVMAKTAYALHYAHELGVIHRDLKPANIMVRFNMEPVVMDFGLAKDMDAETMKLSITGNVMGTPQYMSPEQAQGGHVDESGDIYSLGAVLYEAITRHPPFEGDTIAATIYHVVHTPLQAPRTVNTKIPEALSRICQKALEKEPEQRYASMKDFADDLTAFTENRPIAARGPGFLRMFTRWSKAHRAMTGGMVAGLVIALGLGLMFKAGTWRTGETARDETVRSVSEGTQEERKLSITVLSAQLDDGRLKLDSPEGVDALAALRKAVADDYENVAIAAIEALARLQDKEAHTNIAEQLDSQRPENVRLAAMEALSVLRPKKQNEYLLPIVKDDAETTSVRLAALAAMNIRMSPSQQLVLIRIGAHGRPAALADAASAKLRSARKPEDILSNYATGHVAQASQNMGELMQQINRQQQELEQELEEMQGGLEARKENPEPYAEAVRKLTTGSSSQRLTAAYDLGRLKEKRAEPALLKALQRGENDLSLVAADALGQLPDISTQGLAILRGLLKAELPMTRAGSARALSLVRPVQDGRAVAAVLATEKMGPVQVEMVNALGRLRAAHAESLLSSVLKNGTPQGRRRAAWALGQLGAKSSCDVLLDTLERAGNDDELKEECAAALSSITGKAVGHDAAKWREALKE